MKTIIVSALLLCPALLPAQTVPAGQEPAPVPPETVKPQDPPQYRPDIARIMKDLSVLLEHAGEIPAERMKALEPKLKEFDLKVREAIGKDILEKIAAAEKAKEDRRRTEEAVYLLQAFRASLQIHYGEQGGKYPAGLAELAPKYIREIPSLTLPGHGRTAGVTVIDSRKYDKDYPKAVTDSGGWLYFSDPKSKNYGLLLIDCSHSGPDGLKFYEY